MQQQNNQSFQPQLTAIYGDTYVAESGSAHLGDFFQKNFFRIYLSLPQSRDSNSKRRRWAKKPSSKTVQGKQYARLEEGGVGEEESRQQQQANEENPLMILESHSSDTTLVEDIPLEWLSDHIYEDFSCQIPCCICECHRSQRVVTKGVVLGERISLKAARVGYGHKCERDGEVDYMKTIAIWLPKWMPIKRLIEITKNRNVGTGWLFVLPKLVEDQPIFHYASTGNNTALRQLLSGNQTEGSLFDPNVIRQDTGWTPLHFALEAGQYDICRTLVGAGAKPNMETSSFSTAAYLAATKLLVFYSDPAIRKDLGEIFRGKLEYEKFGFSKLHKIIIFKPDDAVRQIDLLDGKELQNLLSRTDRAGKTALCWAAQLNRPDVVQRLLKKGADIGHQDFGGNSPFHLASQAVDTFALAELLQCDKHNKHRYVAIQNKGGWQALHHAAHYQKQPGFAEMLIEAGANVDARTKAGKTPFMLAALMQRPKVIRLLYQHRADVNCQDLKGWTALSLAIDNAAASLETIDALLDAHVSLQSQSIRLENVLHLVAKTPSLRILKHLASKARSHANYMGYVDKQARNSDGKIAKELLLAHKPTDEVTSEFNTLQGLMDASEAAVARRMD